MTLYRVITALAIFAAVYLIAHVVAYALDAMSTAGSVLGA